MKKVFLIIYLSIKSLFHLSYLLLAIPIIFILAYFLGFTYLQDIKGTDSMSLLTFVYWFDKWFPQIPYWYPLHNGGVVPLWGYPLLSHFLVIFIHKLAGISLLSAFQWLGFLSIPLTALGLYLFVWLRLKNQTMALISAVFYIISPISWAYLFNWGFYAESVSYIFIFPTLIFYDYFLEKVLAQKGNKFNVRLCFIIAVILLSLAYLAHPLLYAVTLFISVVLTLFQVLDKQRKPILKTLFKIILYPSIFALCSILLLSFIMQNQFAYQKYASMPGSPVTAENYIKSFNTLPPVYVLGFEIPPVELAGDRDFVIPFAVWIPAIFGFLAAIFLSRKILAFGILALLSFLVLQFPILAWYSSFLPQIGGIFGNKRDIFYLLRFSMPIIGAFGVWAIFRILLDIPTFWLKKGKIFHLKRIVINFTSAVCSLILAVFLIVHFAGTPEKIWQTNTRYGPKHFDIREPFSTKDYSDICKVVKGNDIASIPKICSIPTARNNFELAQLTSACNAGNQTNKPPICSPDATDEQFKIFLDDCVKGMYPDYCRYRLKINGANLLTYLLDLNNWPKQKNIDIAKVISDYAQPLGFINEHEDDKLLRIDVSPGLGGTVMALNINTEISQVSLYIFTLSLLNPYWGFEQEVLYLPKKNTIDVNNIAKWFGLKYLLLHDSNPIEKYQNDTKNWKLLGYPGAWEFLDSTKLYSWTVHKPAVLVIGSHKVRAYEPFFKTAVNGGYAYDDGWLIQGKENIDDYSLDELKKFDTVVLFGYSYKNRGAAFSTLNKYVRDGGSVFIDTGWQYTDKDWQLSNAPEFFPVNGTKWESDLNTSGKFSLNNPDITGASNTDNFSQLSWKGTSWGVSLPNNGLKDWAKPVLSYDDNPLVVAGQYGQGKVIWSGLNLIGYISTYKYQPDEIQFFNNLLRWLNSSGTNDEKVISEQVGVNRDYPDKVEFTFQNNTDKYSTLYWRESIFPNWQAVLLSPSGQKKDLTIYRGGPGFMLMRLPPLESGSKLILEFKLTFLNFVYIMISIVSAAALLIYLFTGTKLLKDFSNKSFIKKINQRITHLIKDRKKILQDNEDDY